MAYHGPMGATFVPGGFDDDYYMPPPAPVLVAPEPQRLMPEMSDQIQHGIQNMNFHDDRQSTYGQTPVPQTHDYSRYGQPDEVFHPSPFPKLVSPPPNVPPSDEEVEATLENARTTVLNSNDPDMQLAWASDALIWVGVAMDNEERIAAARPSAARSATPRIEHQLKEDAMNVVQFLADQRHPKAEFLRGMWLEWGRYGQREDKKEAFRCYSRAADRGYARAEYRIGMLYESYNDPIKALRHYHRGVDAGDAASCYRLGMMTLRGQHGQQQDYPKAVDLIRRSAQAADENAAQGAYVYGMLLAKELPQVEVPEQYLPYDERNARINIEKAAYLKFAKAQLKMGSAYELGSLGCDFDPALSLHYNALASKQGEPEADMALSKWFLVGHEGLFAKNEELAYTYAERAAQSGLATAEFALGYFHEIGMYVKVDLSKSEEWYDKAAQHGNEDAKQRLDGLSKRQVLSRKDHDQVAIKRITSMYGSQRGARPDQLRQQQPSRLNQSMISENTAVPYGAAPNSSQAPPRSSSVTPYPIDDRPPTVMSNQRPASVAPYPLEDGPPGQPKPTPRLGPAGGFFNPQIPQRPATTLNPEIRPSSAFQINPELRSSSSASVPQLPYGNGRPSGTPQPYGQPSRMASPAYQSDPRIRPGPGPRIASGPPGVQGYPPTGAPGPGPPPRPADFQHSYSNPNLAHDTPPPPSQTPRLDIGFVAPEDDRRNRQYGPARQEKSQSPSLRTKQSTPKFDQGPTSGRTSTPVSKPPDKRPKPASDPPPPPAKETAAAQKPSAPAKPPAKGPKTFDEMGVPKQKKNGECVVM